jgi:hypothetical protein
MSPAASASAGRRPYSVLQKAGTGSSGLQPAGQQPVTARAATSSGEVGPPTTSCQLSCQWDWDWDLFNCQLPEARSDSRRWRWRTSHLLRWRGCADANRNITPHQHQGRSELAHLSADLRCNYPRVLLPRRRAASCFRPVGSSHTISSVRAACWGWDHLIVPAFGPFSTSRCPTHLSEAGQLRSRTAVTPFAWS